MASYSEYVRWASGSSDLSGVIYALLAVADRLDRINKTLETK